MRREIIQNLFYVFEMRDEFIPLRCENIFKKMILDYLHLARERHGICGDHADIFEHSRATGKKRTELADDIAPRGRGRNARKLLLGRLGPEQLQIDKPLAKRGDALPRPAVYFRLNNISLEGKPCRNQNEKSTKDTQKPENIAGCLA